MNDSVISIRELEEALAISTAREYMRGWNKSKPGHDLFFGDKNRIYIPFTGKVGEDYEPDESEYSFFNFMINVDNVFKLRDERVSDIQMEADFMEGYIHNVRNKDDKVKFNKVASTFITKLNKMMKKDEFSKMSDVQLVWLKATTPKEAAENAIAGIEKRRDAYNAFRTKAGNVTKKYKIVISRHPYDVAGMSTDRTGWTSCQFLGITACVKHKSKNPNEVGRQAPGIYYQYVKQEVKIGTIIAYLINDDDDNIKNPIARLLLKPYFKPEFNKRRDVKEVSPEEFEMMIVDKSTTDSVKSDAVNAIISGPVFRLWFNNNYERLFRFVKRNIQIQTGGKYRSLFPTDRKEEEYDVVNFSDNEVDDFMMTAMKAIKQHGNEIDEVFSLDINSPEMRAAVLLKKEFINDHADELEEERRKVAIKRLHKMGYSVRQEEEENIDKENVYYYVSNKMYPNASGPVNKSFYKDVVAWAEEKQKYTNGTYEFNHFSYNDNYPTIINVRNGKCDRHGTEYLYEKKYGVSGYELSEALALSTARKAMGVSGTIRDRNSAIKKIFGSKQRVYLPMKVEANNREYNANGKMMFYHHYSNVFKAMGSLKDREVAEWLFDLLRKVNYETFNPVTGKMTTADGRRSVGINKVFNAYKRLNPDDAGLYKMEEAIKDYNDARARGEFLNKKYEIVISRHPYDVAGMSTGRRWTSCRNLGGGACPISYDREEKSGEHSDEVYDMIELGTCVAYVIEKGDRNIEDPIARLLIHPYKKMKSHSKDGEYFMWVATEIYNSMGMRFARAFKDKVKKWLQVKQKNADGFYRLYSRSDMEAYSSVRVEKGHVIQEIH